MALTQRVSSASTQPRKGQTPSQATISKIASSTNLTYSGTLRQKALGNAPDGGTWENYRKGFRFIKPSMTKSPEMHAHVLKIFKNMPKMLAAMKELHECQASGSSCGNLEYRIDAHVQGIIDDTITFYPEIRETVRPIITPITTPTPTPTPTPTIKPSISPLSIFPIIVVAVVLIGILLFLRRRA